MRIVVFYLFFSVILALTASAQYLQLSENRGEIGVFQGMAGYRGDISPGNYKTFNPSYGGFYKKLLNDYIGIRVNYEKITFDDEYIEIDNYIITPEAAKEIDEKEKLNVG